MLKIISNSTSKPISFAARLPGVTAAGQERVDKRNDQNVKGNRQMENNAKCMRNKQIRLMNYIVYNLQQSKDHIIQTSILKHTYIIFLYMYTHTVYDYMCSRQCICKFICRVTFFCLMSILVLCKVDLATSFILLFTDAKQ